MSLAIQLDKIAQTNPKVKQEYRDGAMVRISAKYVATNYKSITAKLLFPTKGFSLSVFHPSDIRCKVEAYGFDADVNACELNETNQGFTFNYPDWILPHSGVYVAVEEKDLVGEKLSKMSEVDDASVGKTSSSAQRVDEQSS